MALLDEHEVAARAPPRRRRPSEIVGKPMAQLLLGANATVTICHSRTRDLSAVTRAADVLVVAIGHLHTRSPADMVKEGAAVVDVGVTRPREGLAGDVDPAVAECRRAPDAGARRVGPMTIAMLLATRSGPPVPPRSVAFPS